MAKKNSESQFFALEPIPGGPFDEFRREKDLLKDLLPKNSNKYLYRLVDEYGTDELLNITEIPIGDYVYQKGINHAMNMNVGRSIPWIEDGLKSVERRILFIMHQYKYYGSKTSKVASVVGNMITHVYPHGDQAPADTIYRLGRSRTMMIPYIRAGGNYGDMDTMKPAAPRYAEASLSDYAMDCFFAEIGPKRPLYDEKDNYQFNGKEPIFLTSRYPNILMQWNLGIGKGASAWLGAFNSEDIFKTAIAMLDDPNCKVDIYPDAPVPVEIVNKAELKGCFDKSQFKVKMRAPYQVETYQRKNGSKVENVYAIVFTALPLSLTGDQVRKEIIAIKEEDVKKSQKRLPEIIDVQSISDNVSAGGIRIVVEYEHGYDPHILAEKLYKSTSLGKTIGVHYNLITDNQPGEYTPREIMIRWITQRYDQKRRYYHQIVLKSAKDRAMYDAMCIILATKDATDKAINIIRNSKDDDASVEALCKQFKFTEFQARMVLQIQLKTLSKMNIKDTEEKRDQAIADYKHYRKLLADDTAIKDAIRDELKEGLKKYGRSRMAKLKNLKADAGIGDPNETKYVLYNKDFYYCTTDLSDFKTIVPNIDNQFNLIKIKNNDNIVVFDQSGFVKILNGYAFSVNIHGVNMSALGVKNVVSIIVDNMAKSNNEVLMLTQQGYGKIMDMSEVTKSTKSKIMNLSADDTIAGVVKLSANYHPDSIVGIISGDKFAYLRVVDFPKFKRSSAGNRMIKSAKITTINKVVYLDMSDEDDYLMIMCESGYIKLVEAAYLAFNKKGVNIISLQGKSASNALMLHGTKPAVNLYSSNGRIGITMNIDKKVEMVTETGEKQKFAITTSIGSPVKVLKMNKYEWYLFE